MQQLTAERSLIREAAREFTMKRVLLLANKLDPEKGQIPRELIDEMAKIGYFAILIPPEIRRPRPRRLPGLPGRRGVGSRLDERCQPDPKNRS